MVDTKPLGVHWIKICSNLISNIFVNAPPNYFGGIFMQFLL